METIVGKYVEGDKGDKMKIQVGKYTLCSDNYCMWINETCTVKEGKHSGEPYEKRVAGYSTDLRRLLKSFRDNKVNESDAETIEALLEDLARLMDDMCELDRSAFKHDFRMIKEKVNK